MELVQTRAWHSPQLQGPARAGRIRPGERPAWVELPVGRRWWPVWRRCAARHNVAVDAWIAASLELQAVLATANGANSREILARELAGRKTELRLAPTAELRQWARRLKGVEPPPRGDELPTVVVPQRILHRWVPRLVLPDLAPEDGDLAMRCELAACERGLTLEAWALTTLLAGLNLGYERRSSSASRSR